MGFGWKIDVETVYQLYDQGLLIYISESLSLLHARHTASNGFANSGLPSEKKFQTVIGQLTRAEQIYWYKGVEIEDSTQEKINMARYECLNSTAGRNACRIPTILWTFKKRQWCVNAGKLEIHSVIYIKIKSHCGVVVFNSRIL